jgi:hypothetical protein
MTTELLHKRQLTPAERSAVAEIARTAGTFDLGARSTFAETIIQSIAPGELSLELFNLFLPVEQIGLNDDIETVLQRGRFIARPMVEGTSNFADNVFQASKRIFANEKLICGAKVSLGKLRSGDVRSIADIRRQLMTDLMTQIASNVFNKLTTIWNSTETPNNYLSAASLTKPNLDTLITALYDHGDVRAIIGTRRALRPLFEFAGYVTVGSTALAIPRQLQEYGDTGMVSAYNGIPVVVLPQVTNYVYPTQNNKLVRDDVVVIVGQDAGIIALRGEMEMQEHIETRVQPAEYWLHVWQRYGIVINARERVAIYHIV